MPTMRALGISLVLLVWSLGQSGAQNLATADPAQVATAFYQYCGVVPVNIAAINALRCKEALETDRKLSPADLQARAGVLAAVGGHGSLLLVRVLGTQINGDRARVSVLLNYRKLPANKLELALVREDGAWKVAN